MKALSTYKQSQYEGLYTSPEILKAIETIAGDELLTPKSRASKLWACSTAEQNEQIANLAWSYASAEVEELYWANTLAFKR